MNERERLIELLTQAENEELSLLEFEKKILADYLLENNVVVLPCKVGDKVYYICKSFTLSLLPNTIYEAVVVRIIHTSLGTSIVVQIHNGDGCTENPFGQLSKNIFLTKEEAEKALKGGK